MNIVATRTQNMWNAQDSGGLSEYQSREAMELRMMLPRFVAWLEAAGVLVQEPTSKWEVLRYRAVTYVTGTDDPSLIPAKVKPKSHVVYRRGDGSVSWTGDSRMHWAWFRSAQAMVTQPALVAPKKVRSWTERTREKLLDRDGTNCYFCGKTMIGHDHTGRATPDGKDDITIEHLLSKHNTDTHAAEGVDVNHIDYLVLAHAKCNRDIGHRPMSEKLTYRDIMHDQTSTMWSDDA